MRSMTGYGISRWNSNDYCIEVIIQTYNSKNFELRVQAPPFYTSLEGELRKELQKQFSRGSVHLLINRSPSWPSRKVKLQWNKQQALKWKALYKKMASSLNMKNELNLLNLAQQSGVLEIVSQPSIVSVQEKKQLKVLFHKAIELCNKERNREGKVLKKDFQKHLKNLSSCLQKIKSYARQQDKRVRQDIENRIKSFNLTVDKNSIHEIIGSMINKLDINEEISRMEGHIKAFYALVSSHEVKGKKMSFYLQEMIREMNTVGSKSQDFKLTQEVVQAKSTIEKMREQVHNVE